MKTTLVLMSACLLLSSCSTTQRDRREVEARLNYLANLRREFEVVSFPPGLSQEEKATWFLARKGLTADQAFFIRQNLSKSKP